MTTRHAFVLALALLGCSAAPAPTAAHVEAPPPDAPRPDATAANPLAGLAPCSVNAKEGEGCAARPGAGKGKPAGKKIDDVVWKVPVGPNDPVKGPADALVTMVVFSDFECPFCRRGAETLERVLEAYPNDVRLVWKDLPLPMHPRAAPAAELARTARAQKGDDGFWAAHDLLYAAQPDLGDASFQKICDTLGLRWNDVHAAIRTARFGKILQADSDLSDRVDVQATPTTYVNGRKIAGAQPYDTVKAVVDHELETARARVAAGASKATAYATLIANGREVTPPVDTASPGAPE